MKLACIAILLMMTVNSHAQVPTLTVGKSSMAVTERESLGTLQFDVLGEVEFFATRRGKQVLVRAYGADGRLLGRAETLIGLRKTPVYVSTADGLKQLVIMWESDQKSNTP